MDVRPLWGRTPGGGDCSSAGSQRTRGQGVSDSFGPKGVEQLHAQGPHGRGRSPPLGTYSGGGGCSSAGSPCSPADRVFPIHSAPRGSNNCTHRSARPWMFAPFGDVLGRWGLLFRGFAMLTRGYRVVRPPWGRIPAQPTHRRATGRIPHGLHIVVPWVASRTAGASSCHGPHSARSAHRRVMESHPRTAGTSSCRGSHPHTAGASSCHGSHSARPHRADGPEGVALLCSRG